MAEKRNFKIKMIVTTEDDKISVAGEFTSEQIEQLMDLGLNAFHETYRAIVLEIKREEYRKAHGFEMPLELYDKC
jgi:hypothetical protein